MKNLTVLLLAGGKSSRFWPLPHKMTIPYLGKPFIEHQIDLLKKLGFSNIVLVATQEVSKLVTGNVTKIIQIGEGQAAAILSAEAYIAGPLLIVNADDIVAQSLFESVLYLANERWNLLVGYKTDHYFPGGYLVLEGKRVARIHEKPGAGNEPSSFVRIVCDYFVRGEKLIENLKQHEGIEADVRYEHSLSSMMQAGELFEMLEYEDTWIPIKFPWHVLSASEYYLGILRKNAISKTTHIHPTASIEGPVVIEEGARVMEYAKIVGPAFIGKEAIIGNHTLIRASMIGEKTVVGFGSEITRSFVGSKCWFHTNYIGDSVIENNVGVGAGAVFANLRLDEREIQSTVLNERVNSKRVKLGAIIGENSRIGIESQLMPGVKIGKNSIIGPGVIMIQDLPDNKKCFNSQIHSVTDNVSANPKDRNYFRSKL